MGVLQGEYLIAFRPTFMDPHIMLYKYRDCYRISKDKFSNPQYIHLEATTWGVYDYELNLNDDKVGRFGALDGGGFIKERFGEKDGQLMQEIYLLNPDEVLSEVVPSLI